MHNIPFKYIHDICTIYAGGIGFAHPHELASGLLSREKANVGSETVDVSLLENQKSYESDSED